MWLWRIPIVACYACNLYFSIFFAFVSLRVIARQALSRAGAVNRLFSRMYKYARAHTHTKRKIGVNARAGSATTMIIVKCRYRFNERLRRHCAREEVHMNEPPTCRSEKRTKPQARIGVKSACWPLCARKAASWAPASDPVRDEGLMGA